MVAERVREKNGFHSIRSLRHEPILETRNIISQCDWTQGAATSRVACRKNNEGLALLNVMRTLSMSPISRERHR